MIPETAGSHEHWCRWHQKPWTCNRLSCPLPYVIGCDACLEQADAEEREADKLDKM